jgi:hypothetical protein
METTAAIIALITAIIMAVKAYIEKKPKKIEVKPDEIEKFEEAAATGDKDTVNIANHDHDRRLRNLISRWKKHRAKSGRDIK